MTDNKRVDLSLKKEEFHKKYGRNKKLSTYTLGCKVNQYETEAMCELFQKDGYDVVKAEEIADVYVINTCTVTNLGDRKSRQFIRRAKRQNENAVIAVVGCYSQIAPEEVKSIEGVNLVIGTNERSKIVEIIRNINSEDNISMVDNIMEVRKFEEMKIDNLEDRTRAFLKIQEGCNQYCSYCIIPYARGPVRSREKENIVNEVKRLVKNGFKEVVLTGIHVASYGKDFKTIGLIDIIKEVNAVEGLERIRLSSIEPTLLDEDFMKELSTCEKFCDHFHLSLQSGSNGVLKRMNRRYTKEEYGKIVENIRKYYPDASITTDLIVGFPGESDEEFMEGMDFIKTIDFYQIHVFKYSPRKGTPAAIMKDQISGDIKNQRSDKIISVASEMEEKFLNRFVGKTIDILFEEKKDGYYIGHSKNYLKVKVEDKGQDLENSIKNVIIEKVDGKLLFAKII
jgi:threonylcarbamoyladenosine tRNA methylthiotransferase MtaB